MNIGTAKVREEEKENIPHHLFSFKNVDEEYTVYEYQKDARNKIIKLKKQNKIPIIVGGSNLYLSALLYDYKFNDDVKKIWDIDVSNYDFAGRKDWYRISKYLQSGIILGRFQYRNLKSFDPW